MWANFGTWLNKAPLKDQIEQQQAGLVQIILMAKVLAALLSLPIAFTTGWLTFGATALDAILNILAIVLVRKGSFQPAVLLGSISILIPLTTNLIISGTRGADAPYLLFAVPIILAGLLSRRSGLTLVAGLSIAIVATVTVLEQTVPWFPHYNEGNVVYTTVVGFSLTICLISLFLNRFSYVLRKALLTAITREQELEQLRVSLEATVAERTASLQKTVSELQATQATVHELNAPVIPVLEGVLAAPLIGAIDSSRAAMLSDNILQAVSQRRAQHVILDITGVPVVDTQVAQTLLQIAGAVRLLGAQVCLVGIRPEVAQTMVTLGIDLQKINTYSNMQEAIGALLGQIEYTIYPTKR